jgi:hypothetical protein
MKNTQEIKINKKNMELSKTLRSEFHFLKYPFFNLCTNDTKRFIIKIEEIEKTEEGEIETLWKVSRDVEADFPSSFARRIHKEVVEKILDRKRSPSRLIKLGSLWEICKSIKLAPSGRSYIKIKKALEDIVKANITTKRTFKLKKDDGRMEFFDGTFHLYDGVYFLGQRLPDGTEADAVYVLLNDMYLQNFNHNFIVPLDYDYIHSLKGNIASRMYEILILWFYPTFINKRKYIEKKYSNLCDYFPLIKQDIKWKAKKQLSLAHQQHVAKGFLESDPLWSDIGKKDDWLLRYYIGPRAEQWYYSIKKGLQPIDISEQKQIVEPTENKTEENPLLQKLLSLKIPLKKAEQLINNHNNIEDWIEALDLMKPKNRAGFLVAALTKRWELPDDFKKRRAERNQKKEEELKKKYFEHTFEQVDKLLAKKMNDVELEKEMELHKEEFLRKYPKYKQFESNIFLMPFVKDDYRRTMAVKLKLPSFEQWKEQRI